MLHLATRATRSAINLGHYVRRFHSDLFVLASLADVAEEDARVLGWEFGKTLADSIVYRPTNASLVITGVLR